MVEEDAIRGACDSFAIAVDVPCDSNARLEIQVRGRHTLGESEGLVGCRGECSGRWKAGQELDVVAQTVVHRQPRLDAPGILGEDAEGVVVEREVRIADTLHHVLRNARAIGLDRGQARSTGEEMTAPKS